MKTLWSMPGFVAEFVKLIPSIADDIIDIKISASIRIRTGVALGVEGAGWVGSSLLRVEFRPISAGLSECVL